MSATLAAPPKSSHTTRHRSNPISREESSEKIGFLTIFMGGTGLEAAHIFSTHRRGHADFPECSIYLDTDPKAKAPTDHLLYLSNGPDVLEALHADPDRFGPHVAPILRKQRKLLHPEDVGNGARTVRSLTQLVFAYYRLQILAVLERCLIDLTKAGRCKHVMPILVSSSGGGTGSALHILLAQALLDPTFKSQLTRTLSPNTLFSPIGFAAEPYAYAIKHGPLHANKVLSNAMAFRIESAELLKQRGFSYVFHIAMSNGHGTVLDNPEDLAHVLGTSVFLCEQNFMQMKSSWVDTVDSNFSAYSGSDIPECRSGDDVS